MQKVKLLLSNKLMLFQMICLVGGKIAYSLVELPKHEKEGSYLVELFMSTLLYAGCISLKVLRHKAKIFMQLPKLIIQSFLILVVTVLILMFSFALQDKLKWVFLEKMLSILALVLQVLSFILVTDSRFISKRQFICYEGVLASNVVALAYKCVWFLTYEADSDIKDILLLNLTTQIALSIILMDVIERSYVQQRKNRNIQVSQEMNRIERELQMSH